MARQMKPQAITNHIPINAALLLALLKEHESLSGAESEDRTKWPAYWVAKRVWETETFRLMEHA